MKLIDYTAWIVVFIITLLLDSTIVSVMPNVSILDWFFVFLGKEFIIFFIGAAITISFICYKKQNILKLWLGLFITILVSYIVKILIQRPRPFIVYSFKPLAQSFFAHSFPSITTAAVFAMLPFMSKSFPKGKAIWWTIAILIGFSRLYLGVHFISDVVFGAFVGYFIADIFLEHSRKKYAK